MATEKDKEIRNISRDFKGKVKLMEKTPLRDLDKMFSETKSRDEFSDLRELLEE